jgi:hypothetical protein
MKNRINRQAAIALGTQDGIEAAALQRSREQPRARAAQGARVVTYVELTDITPNRATICKVVESEEWPTHRDRSTRVALWTGDKPPTKRERCWHRGADFRTDTSPTAWSL